MAKQTGARPHEVYFLDTMWKRVKILAALRGESASAFIRRATAREMAQCAKEGIAVPGSENGHG